MIHYDSHYEQASVLHYIDRVCSSDSVVGIYGGQTDA